VETTGESHCISNEPGLQRGINDSASLEIVANFNL
jgi:hypothetical protein